MSETNNSPQGQKAKTSRLAIASAFVGVCGVCSRMLSQIFWFPNSPADEVLFSFLFFFPYIATPLAFASGIVALVRIKKPKSSRMLKGRGFAVVGITTAVLLLAVLFILPFIPSSSAYREACATGMDIVAMQLRIYASDHDNKYPAPHNWCDLLIKYTSTTQEILSCPATKKERCTYAMNPNCEPNSPPDMVLLFETKGGWNQSGGLEILTTENHKPKGCNILFNDRSMKFVKTKNLAKLKWKVEDGEELR